MENNFDFDKVGKRMPYKVPEHFFDKIPESTLAEAERRQSIKKETSWFSWPAMAVAASLVLLLVFGYVFYMNRTVQDTEVAILDEEVIPAERAKVAANTEIIEPPAPTVVAPVSEKAETRITTETTKPAKQAIPKPAQLAKSDKPESLDDVLADITDEELMLLAAVAETDLNVYEQTFE